MRQREFGRRRYVAIFRYMFPLLEHRYPQGQKKVVLLVVSVSSARGKNMLQLFGGFLCVEIAHGSD